MADHATLVVEQVDGFRGMLADVLTVNTTPFALVLMAIVCTGLYLIFERRGWL